MKMKLIEKYFHYWIAKSQTETGVEELEKVDQYMIQNFTE